MMLVTVYILYVISLKFNVKVEQALKTRLHKHENSVQVVEAQTVKMPCPVWIFSSLFYIVHSWIVLALSHTYEQHRPIMIYDSHSDKTSL